MSCTVVAIPWAIAWIVGAMVAGAGAGIASKQLEGEDALVYIANKKNANNLDLAEPCNDVYVISEKELLEKSFETPFMDKNILMKTLEEHGVVDIKESEYGQIKGICGQYELSFERMEADKPYSLVITYLSTGSAEEKFKDLTSEYAINVQEESYNNIVEKLKENNMEIEDEEVMDDNTIVLTINLE